MRRERIVVLGAGQAGGWAALTLRSEGFQGDIVMVGEESHMPYERPPLSKGVLAGTATPEMCRLVDSQRYSEKQIRHVARRCTRIRCESRELMFETGEPLFYDKLIITTGTRARRLTRGDVPAERVHYLRTLEDAVALRADLANARRLLVIGGGWIGLEVAATARAMGAEVTVAESAAQLCGRSLDAQASGYLEALHREHGTDIRLKADVLRLEGDRGVKRAVFGDGSMLDVDCVVIGIGVVPNDELASAAGIATDNGIVVDGFGRTSVDRVYAAGDVARHPNAFLGRDIRLETWEHAQNHGIHVAKAVLGTTDTPYAEVPWVWSDQYDCNVQIMGFPPSATDTTIVRGDPASGAFTFVYLRGCRLWGAVAFNQGRDLKILRRLMAAGRAVTPEWVTSSVPELMKQIPR